MLCTEMSTPHPRPLTTLASPLQCYNLHLDSLLNGMYRRHVEGLQNHWETAKPSEDES